MCVFGVRRDLKLKFCPCCRRYVERTRVGSVCRKLRSGSMIVLDEYCATSRDCYVNEIKLETLDVVVQNHKVSTNHGFCLSICRVVMLSVCPEYVLPRFCIFSSIPMIDGVRVDACSAIESTIDEYVLLNWTQVKLSIILSFSFVVSWNTLEVRKHYKSRRVSSRTFPNWIRVQTSRTRQDWCRDSKLSLLKWKR